MDLEKALKILERTTKSTSLELQGNDLFDLDPETIIQKSETEGLTDDIPPPDILEDFEQYFSWQLTKLSSSALTDILQKLCLHRDTIHDSRQICEQVETEIDMIMANVPQETNPTLQTNSQLEEIEQRILLIDEELNSRN